MQPEILYFDNGYARLTVQDGLHAIETRNYNVSSNGRIDVCGYQLPSDETLWCAALDFFDKAGRRILVPLVAARHCSALLEGKEITLGVDELHDSEVDLSGIVKLRDGRFISGITLKPTHRTSSFTIMEKKILFCVIRLCEAESVCLCHPYGGPLPEPPEIDRLALTHLTLPVHLQVVQREYSKLFKRDKLPSLQKVSGLLRECGVKLRKTGRKAKVATI